MLIDNRKLIVWDLLEDPRDTKDLFIAWKAPTEKKHLAFRCVTDLVEEDADYFRAKFLTWIYTIGNSKFGGESLRDLLRLPNGLSYWWMTTLAERSNVYATNNVDRAIKLIALEEYIKRHRISSVCVESKDRSLIIAIFHLCKINKLNYDNDFTVYWCFKTYLINVLKMLFTVVLSLTALLKYIFVYFSNRQNCAEPLTKETFDVFFVDALVHLDQKSFSTKIFTSNYWGDLPKYMAKWGTKAKWLHHYNATPQIKNLAEAISYAKQFTASSSGSALHTILDQYFRLGLIPAILHQYFRLVYLWFTTRAVRPLCGDDSQAYLWYLFSDDWRESLTGSRAIFSLIRVYLFEEIFDSIPIQKRGVYICEHQAWEMAFVHAWKRHGHGKLIAVPHSTVRFWDLRYFFDPRTFSSNEIDPRPLPDYWALNGPAARENLILSGFPEEKLVNVEALRYLHLNNTKFLRGTQRNRKGKIQLLVLGDFEAKRNKTLFQDWILPLLKKKHLYEIRYRPHPGFKDDIVDLERFGIRNSKENLNDLLVTTDLAICSGLTSASADAYCSGIPVVQILASDSFDMSPLRGRNGIYTVRLRCEFYNVLKNALAAEPVPRSPVFYLEKNLPKWKKLLA